MEIFTETGSYNPLMMPIDTLSIAKMLEAAGTPQKQAEAHAKMWGEFNMHNLSTKADVSKVEERIVKTEARLEEKIVQTEAKLEEKIAQTEARLEEKIEQLRKDTIIEIANINANLKSEISKCKTDMIKWVVSLIFAQTIAIMGSIGWLFSMILKLG